MEEATKKTIEMMGIYELRTLARNVGVPSPTTLKRQQLLDAITEIMDGVKDASPIKKVGRPPKTTKLDTSVMDVFVPQDFIDYAKEEKERVYADESLMFRQELDLSRFDGKIRVERQGFLRKTKSGAYFFKDGENLVFVPSNLIAECKLIEGDLLQGGAWQIQDKPFDVFYILEKLNYKKFEINKRELTAFLNIRTSSNALDGIRKFIKIDDLTQYINETHSILKNYSENGYIINFLAVGLVPELILKIKSSFDDVEHIEFISFYEDGPKESFEISLDSINNSISLARSGSKVLLFVFDVSTLISELKVYFEESVVNQNPNYNTLLIMRKLFSVNRSLVGGGCVSLLCGTSENIDINYM